jgi:hypothetical protein
LISADLRITELSPAQGADRRKTGGGGCFMPDAPPPPEKQTSAGSSAEGGGSQANEAKQDLNLWRLVGLGTELAGVVAFFTAMGWWLDARFGWTPWGMSGFGMLGVIVGLYRFIRAASR